METKSHNVWMDGWMYGWMVVIKHNTRPVKCEIIHRGRVKLLPDFFFPTGSLRKRQDIVRRRLNWCSRMFSRRYYPGILMLNTYKKTQLNDLRGVLVHLVPSATTTAPFSSQSITTKEKTHIHEVGTSKDLTFFFFFCLKHY